jgi:hypothetical protein
MGLPVVLTGAARGALVIAAEGLDRGVWPICAPMARSGAGAHRTSPRAR